MMDQNPAESSQQDDIPVVGQRSLTQKKEVKCKYTWTIDNFNLLSEGTCEVIISPLFSVEANDNIKWRLELYLYPRGFDCGRGFISVFLKLISFDKSEVIASYNSILVLNCDYIKTNVKTLQTKFQKNAGYGYDGRHFFLEESYRLLNGTKLMICCELTFNVDAVDISGQGDLVQMNPRECVSDDIGKLFEDKRLSDVTVVAAGGRKIQAHKLILVARSAVFAAMFEHDMQEQKQNRVDITDVDYDTLTAMLHYMYTGRVTNINKVAADLLVAADKYVLHNLKVMCEEALCSDLSIETAADTLVLADLHSAALLKEKTVAFINSELTEMVIETEGWKKMISTHPHLVAELFKKYVQLQKHQA